MITNRTNIRAEERGKFTTQDNKAMMDVMATTAKLPKTTRVRRPIPVTNLNSWLNKNTTNSRLRSRKGVKAKSVANNKSAAYGPKTLTNRLFKDFSPLITEVLYKTGGSAALFTAHGPYSRMRTNMATSKNTEFNRAVKIWLGKAARWFVVPTFLYTVIFYITQPHYLTNFSSRFYLDTGDGYQNVWNIWWVFRSIAEQGASPYWTNMLEWPHGTTLIPQTMNIINGFAGIPLMGLFHLSLIQAVNLIVLAAFAFGGLTMFWFIQKLYGKYWVSLVAGALFTFSSYHFAHGQGHLQLVTIQFVPLFLLLFWQLVEKPRYRYAALSALALTAVMLSDYYYLVWCVMLGGAWVLWNVYKKHLQVNIQNLKVFSLFGGLSIVLMGPLIYKLSELSKPNVLLGSHDPVAFSLDPLTIIIPGGSWIFSGLTDWHWTRLPYLSEMSVYFGMGLLALLAVAGYQQFIAKKKTPKRPEWLTFWWIILIVFGILALGPRLHLFGKHLLSVPLPYAWLEHLWPTLKISGMPVRWIFISLIAAIVIGSYVLTQINLKKRSGQILLVVFILVSCIELWPGRLPAGETKVRPYVQQLQQLPKGAVIDNGALSSAQQLYHQTVHGKPMAFGYVTRIPKEVEEKNFHIFAALEQGRHDELCRVYKVRYVTTPTSRPLKTSFPAIYNDGDTIIYDMKNSEACEAIVY